MAAMAALAALAGSPMPKSYTIASKQGYGFDRRGLRVEYGGGGPMRVRYRQRTNLCPKRTPQTAADHAAVERAQRRQRLRAERRAAQSLAAKKGRE